MKGTIVKLIPVILAVAALSVSSGAEAFFPGQLRQPCDWMPPASAQQVISVPVRVSIVKGRYINAACQIRPSAMEYGCMFFPPSRGSNVYRIWLNADMNAKERACTLVYERAHMPPNDWLDPVVESWGKK